MVPVAKRVGAGATTAALAATIAIAHVSRAPLRLVVINPLTPRVATNRPMPPEAKGTGVMHLAVTSLLVVTANAALHHAVIVQPAFASRGDSPRGDRPFSGDRERTFAPRGDKPAFAPRGDKPFSSERARSDNPYASPRADRTPSDRPAYAGKSARPSREFAPRAAAPGGKTFAPRGDGPARTGAPRPGAPRAAAGARRGFTFDGGRR